MFEPKMREMLLMPKLGSFELFTEVPEGTTGVGPVGTFYWRDRRHPLARGPFVSLWACVEDFKLILAESKNPPPPGAPAKIIAFVDIPKPCVINIDFVTKKRL